MSLPDMIATWVTAFGVPSLLLVAPLQHACHIVSSIHIVAGFYAGPECYTGWCKEFYRGVGSLTLVNGGKLCVLYNSSTLKRMDAAVFS